MMSKFKEFATSVRKIATSEVVLAQLEILEKEHDQLRERLKEADEVIDSIHDYGYGVNHRKMVVEYKTKYRKERGMNNQEVIDLTDMDKDEICHIKCHQRKLLQEEIQSVKAQLKDAEEVMQIFEVCLDDELDKYEQYKTKYGK